MYSEYATAFPLPSPLVAKSPLCPSSPDQLHSEPAKMRPKRVCTEAVTYKAPAADGDDEREGSDASDGFDSGDDFDGHAENGEDEVSTGKNKALVTRKTAAGTRVDPVPYWKEITVAIRKPKAAAVPAATAASTATVAAEATSAAAPAEAKTQSKNAKEDEIKDRPESGPGGAEASTADTAAPTSWMDSRYITTTKKIRIQERVWQDMPKWGNKKKSPL